MARLTYKDVDFSGDYKTFCDLKDGDSIFILDYKELKIEEYKIDKYKKEDKSSSFSKGYYIISFEIPALNNKEINIYNGNQLIAESRDEFYSTDKRICESILDIIRHRNGYQWNTITHCFGNPMSRYADKPVILG